MIFQRKEFEFGSVKVYLLGFSDYEPADFLDQLTRDELERYYSFINLQRKREFVATRILRHEIFGFQHIHYDSVGAPFIEDEGYISISHSKNMVGIALCQDFKMGLDIEQIHPKIEAIKHKFLSVEEMIEMDCESTAELTKIWSAKEVLYKLSGRKGINFRTELLLSKITEDKWKGKVINPDHDLTTEINIFELENKIITVNTHACEQKFRNI